MLIPLEPSDPREVGPYRLLGRLGVGGMGVVYRGVGREGRAVAVKLPHEEIASDPSLRERFAQEVSVARRVRGAFVAEVLDAEVAAVRPWMATEYVDGMSLADTVRTRGLLAGTTLVALAAGLAHALVTIHAAGVVHNDLNPANVVMAWDGPKVVDFGAALAADTSRPATRGIPGGTAAWMAPEHISGEQAGAPADVFAWATCVAFAATGRHPFGAESAGATVARILTGEPDLAGVPQLLVPPVRHGLSRAPTARPTAVQLAAFVMGPKVAPSR